MAIRGARPKPPALRIVDGTHRPDRHGPRAGAEARAAESGGLARPSALKGEARKAWDRWIASASWLDVSKEPAAIAFCHLWSEFIAGPEQFQAARHGQMRSYMSELGLTDERSRAKAAPDKVDPADEFLAR